MANIFLSLLLKTRTKLSDNHGFVTINPEAQIAIFCYLPIFSDKQINWNLWKDVNECVNTLNFE